jgi:hypothetical protein
MYLTTLEEAEITPEEAEITPLTNGHGRYMTVTPERTFFPLGNGRYISVA